MNGYGDGYGGGGVPTFGRSPQYQMFGGYGGPQPYTSSLDWRKAARGVGNYLTKHPEVVTGALGIGASLYGASKDRAAAERQQGQENVYRGQELGLEERNVAVNEKEMQARLEADAREVARRRAAIKQILAMGRYIAPQNRKQSTQMES